MRRIIGVVLAGGFTLAATGCVAVSAKNNRWASNLDAVVVDGKVYVVNVRTGQVAPVDMSCPTTISALTDDDCDD